MSLIRKLGLAYSALFVIVAANSYVPQFKDANGMMFGGVLDLDLTTRILANLPHLAIGGFAAYAGFVLSKHHGEAA